ncbi:saccharopine dehydrogenase family protein [Streptacidiphilus griseoplanus]|uniref:saccharopine dehydrogenase family protein n=1 Tax=Peterkaempfera griseoplana TaxID=66896 RepID=UPI0006E40E3E|nr:saccharopine dehydrogenase NADP-binding domain-containing protein [Peterkaempfera griseoplana]
MRIAVYGASGFTGRLAVAELRRRGIATALVGRDPDRLQAVGGAGAAVRVADPADPAALTAAFADCDAVVNCAGPFTFWGEPVVRAAIGAGAHYVDTTGEQHYLRRVFDGFGAQAERAGVTVVPAMTDDGGPGDLIAALTAARVAPVDRLLIADLREPGSGASRGTARSMAAIGDEEPLEYRDGALRPADGPAPQPIVPPGGADAVPLSVFALPGVVTVPRHVTARRVHGAIRSEVAALFAALTPDVVESVPETVPEEVRSAGRWLMAAEAVGADGRSARGWVTGHDAYGLTAVIAVEGALRLAAGKAAPGVLSPAQAFEPAGFLDALAPSGVRWQVD